MTHRLRKQPADKAMLALPLRIMERFEDCGGGGDSDPPGFAQARQRGPMAVPAPVLTPHPAEPTDGPWHAKGARVEESGRSQKLFQKHLSQCPSLHVGSRPRAP